MAGCTESMAQDLVFESSEHLRYAKIPRRICHKDVLPVFYSESFATALPIFARHESLDYKIKSLCIAYDGRWAAFKIMDPSDLTGGG